MTCLLRTTYVTYVTYDVILLINKMLWKEDRVLIKVLRVENGYGAKRIKTKFPGRNLSLSSVKRLLHQSDTTASADRKSGSGRRRTARAVARSHERDSCTAFSWDTRLLTSSVHSTGHRTARTSIRLTTRSVAFCKSEFTITGSVMSTTWKNDWLQNGADLTRISLTAVDQWRERLCGRVCQRERRTLWASNLNDQTI